GGWVYWDRIPLLGVEQVEVVRGGGSSAWGNYALGGVINIITRKPVERAGLFDGSYGNHNTVNIDGLVSEVQGPFRVGLEGNYFNTEGYLIVKASDRGSIDVPASSQQPALEGNRLAQVPQQGATLGVTYDNPRWFTASAMARYVGSQFEDDQNTLRLG